MDLMDSPYTGKTILTSGEHKFTALCRVPAKYLLHAYYKQNKNGNYPDKKLIAYIEAHLEEIQSPNWAESTEIEGIKYRPLGNHTHIICKKTNKVIYASKKDAKDEIHRIKNLPQGHKKPNRAYDCTYCNGWHLTSTLHNKWK